VERKVLSLIGWSVQMQWGTEDRCTTFSIQLAEKQSRWRSNPSGKEGEKSAEGLETGLSP